MQTEFTKPLLPPKSWTCVCVASGAESGGAPHPDRGWTRAAHSGGHSVWRGPGTRPLCPAQGLGVLTSMDTSRAAQLAAPSGFGPMGLMGGRLGTAGDRGRGLQKPCGFL